MELIENPLPGFFDVAQLQGIHRYLFQDVYEWAGHFRTVDIAKGNSYFAHVPYIRSTLDSLFETLSNEQQLRGLDQEAFARRGAEILGTLNAVHPFREGNGRTQREFVRQLAHKNGYWVDWSKVSREELYKASDVSFMRGQNELFLFGPRVYLPSFRRVTPFAEGLFGLAHTTGGTAFSIPGSRNSFAMAPGGGLDVAATI